MLRVQHLHASPLFPASVDMLTKGDFERDPTLDPSREGGCGNPPATNNIKCVFWGSRLTRAMARNSGERRADFEVVIMGTPRLRPPLPSSIPLSPPSNHP